MTQRYLGGIITANPVEPSSNLSTASASGMWTLQEALSFYKAGDWPDPTNVPSVGVATRGQVNPLVVNIDKFVPESAGNATDFGDLTVARHASSSMGNDTRGIFAGGWDNYGGSSLSNVVDYITYATAGNATDFGDVAATSSDANASASNNVRGITFGGRLVSNGNIDNAIEYLTIASTGNATDFADLSITTGTTANKARHRQGNGMSGSSTRGLASGGYTPAALSNVIQYVTIASVGNSTDFGDMSSSTDELAHMSSNTRGVIAGGSGGGSTFINTIEYVTIASTGNVTDFGDMTVAKAYLMGASSSTKGFILGGYTGSADVNTIETITFSTTGDATDFGDLSAVSRSGSANASSHAAVQNESYFPPAAIGLFAGSTNAGQTTILYVNIATDGEGAMFGDAAVARGSTSGGSASSTRAVFAGGGSSGINNIDYVEFSTKGKGTDFGNLNNSVTGGGQLSSSTRGIHAGGLVSSRINVIDYFTIANAGNATDFGDLTAVKNNIGSAGGTTRGLFFGGYSSSYLNVIEYITIASTGNATDFGDLSNAVTNINGVASNTRALLAGGYSQAADARLNVVEYVTIASTGNATDFGDMSAASDRNAGVTNKTTALFHASQGNVGYPSVDKFTIASTGNAADWGDLVGTQHNYNSTSNSHGGIA